MKAVQLINGAYNLAGIVARDMDQVQGSEGRDGLFWLNQVISELSSNGDYLPYYGRQSFPAVVGQQEYRIENFVTLDSITFFIGSVRYSMKGESRRNYFGSSRAEDVLSLPYQYYYEKGHDGINVFFYFKPAQIYIFEAVGITALPQVTNDTELNDSLDGYYQSFLMFLLMERLCQWNQISVPPSNAMQLQKFKDKIYNINPKDVTINKRSLLSAGSLLTFAQVAFGRGWTR